ncbi:MAG TPA: Asp23/Gls24 family envelope stress response protein [Deinococcales bacterium]|nr:Asp23/Gls24 family envelope stress response protein [Deinococcales bacterium]
MRGNITVTENALASLLGLAAHEVPGVVGMAPANIREGLQKKILGRAQARDGVIVSGEGSSRAVEVFVVVAFGVNISAVAQGVRERITHVAQAYAGVALDAVKVHVVGVAQPAGMGRRARGA